MIEQLDFETDTCNTKTNHALHFISLHPTVEQGDKSILVVGDFSRHSSLTSFGQ